MLIGSASWARPPLDQMLRGIDFALELQMPPAVKLEAQRPPADVQVEQSTRIDQGPASC